MFILFLDDCVNKTMITKVITQLNHGLDIILYHAMTKTTLELIKE